MTSVDEARAALLAAWSLKEPTPKLAAFEAAVRAEYEAKLAALRPYLDHYAKCPTSTAGIPKSQCTCGLVAALDATEAER